LRTSAETGLGIEELIDRLDAHRTHLVESGEGEIRKRSILETRILKTAEDLLRQRIGEGDTLTGFVESALGGELSPRQAAEELLKTV
jgi:LAO/AO transport system kinase